MTLEEMEDTLENQRDALDNLARLAEQWHIDKIISDEQAYEFHYHLLFGGVINGYLDNIEPYRKPVIKLREHRGSLDESMRTIIYLPATREAITQHIQNTLKFYGDIKLTSDMVHVEYYAKDLRIDWNITYIVIIDTFGVFGFTDGPLID